MSWRLIFLLSLLGLGMGFATVYGLPSKMEAFIWLPLFVLSAFIIGRYAGKRYFLHGLIIGLCNSVWMVAIHIKFSEVYLAHHPAEAAQFMKMHSESGATIAQCIMLTGGFAGIISGLVLGLFTLMASGYLKKIGG